MNRLRRVVNNTLISLFGQAVTWISTLLLTIAYGRFLGDVKFGELYFAITFVALIGFPIEFGFNQQITRDISQEPDKARRYFSNILLIKGVLWLFLYSLLLLICWLLGYGGEERALVGICGLTLLSTAMTNTFASIHYAFERTLYPVIGSILEKGLGALVGILLLKYGAGVEMMALVLLGGSLTNTLFQAGWFFRLSGARFSVDRALVRSLLLTSIPFLIYGVLGVIYYRIDTILLSLLTNTAEVGWYGAGYRLFDTLLFLPTLVISAIMYPVFSKLSLHSREALKLAIEKTMNFLLFCGVPIATLLMVAAPNIVGFLYHQQFEQTIPILIALAPGLVFLYINSVLGSVLMSIKLEKKITLMAAIALVFNLSLNLALIPLFQGMGAAIVTSLTELLLLVLTLIFVPRDLLPLGSLLIGGRIVLAAGVMALVVWQLRSLNIFLLLAAAAPVYVCTALLIGALPMQDIQSIYDALRNKVQRSPAREAGESLQDSVLEAMSHNLMYPIDELPTLPMAAIAQQSTLPMAAIALQSTRPLQAVSQQPTRPLQAVSQQLHAANRFMIADRERELTLPMTYVPWYLRATAKHVSLADQPREQRDTGERSPAAEKKEAP